MAVYLNTHELGDAVAAQVNSKDSSTAPMRMITARMRNVAEMANLTTMAFVRSVYPARI